DASPALDPDLAEIRQEHVARARAVLQHLQGAALAAGEEVHASRHTDVLSPTQAIDADALMRDATARSETGGLASYVEALPNEQLQALRAHIERIAATADWDSWLLDTHTALSD